MMNAKQAIQSLWKDTCTVITRTPYKLPDRSTGFKADVIAQDEPCKLSFSQIPTVTNDGVASSMNQTIKLFLDSTVNIPPGSKIEITRNGKTTAYAHSGPPAIYTNHQEITLRLFDKWA